MDDFRTGIDDRCAHIQTGHQIAYRPMLLGMFGVFYAFKGDDTWPM